MIGFPLYLVLFLYFAFLMTFAVFMFMNIYHLVATGSLTFASFCMTFCLWALTVIVFYGTWYFLRDTDWQATVVLFQNDWYRDVNL